MKTRDMALRNHPNQFPKRGKTWGTSTKNQFLQSPKMRDLTESQKILFLLAFTHELLRNSGGNIFTLEHIVEERETERGQASTEFTGILKQERKASEQQRSE